MSGSGKKFFVIFAACALAATAVLAAPLSASPFLSPSAAVNVVGNQVPDQTAPSSAVADVCLPLLKTAAQPDTRNIITQDVRPDAGQAAALGLIFGVRYALGPKEATRPGPALKGTANADLSGDRALAIAEYRRCRSEQLLTSL
jgi:hypothetical protein